ALAASCGTVSMFPGHCETVGRQVPRRRSDDRPILTAASITTTVTHPHRTTHHQSAFHPPVGTAPDRLSLRPESIDGPPGADAIQSGPAARGGPSDRTACEPTRPEALRSRYTGRARPRRHQEAGKHP